MPSTPNALSLCRTGCSDDLDVGVEVDRFYLGEIDAVLIHLGELSA
jgi:hypothetical protein